MTNDRAFVFGVPMFDAYRVYCDHCRAMGQTPPSREWWDRHRTTPAVTKPDDQFEIDTERREGWAYGQ